MTRMTGRCRCGAIRWEITGETLWQVHCHCDDCRRATSSAFTSYIGVLHENVQWTGPAPVAHNTSPGVERSHCGDCGSPILFVSQVWPDEAHLFAASLDDPSQFQPQAHVFWAERVAWGDVHDSLPKYPTLSDQSKPAPDAP